MENFTSEQQTKEKPWPSLREILGGLADLKSADKSSIYPNFCTCDYKKPRSLERDEKWVFGRLVLGIFDLQDNRYVQLVMIDVEREKETSTDRAAVINKITQIMGKNPACYFERKSSCDFFLPTGYLGHIRRVFEWSGRPFEWAASRELQARIGEIQNFQKF